MEILVNFIVVFVILLCFQYSTAMMEDERPYYALFKENKANAAFTTIGALSFFLAFWALSHYDYIQWYLLFWHTRVVSAGHD
jgi:hypothetical protein